MKKLFLSLFLIACSSKKPQTEELTIYVLVPVNSAQTVQEEAKPGEVTPCQKDMIEIKGEYCNNISQTCLKWDDAVGKFEKKRCLKFKEPSECKSKKEMHYCIDKFEHKEQDSNLPISDISWTDAQEVCKSEGKRLCKGSEWQFSCQGTKGNPYPTGFERPSNLCNFDKKVPTKGKDIVDSRMPYDSNLECKSEFNVVNLVGNVDEWVESDIPYYHSDSKRKLVSELRGGWHGPLRNRCNVSTQDHDEFYKQITIGFRCCSDIK